MQFSSRHQKNPLTGKTDHFRFYYSAAFSLDPAA
jgi:hypothetical protein